MTSPNSIALMLDTRYTKTAVEVSIIVHFLYY